MVWLWLATVNLVDHPDLEGGGSPPEVNDLELATLGRSLGEQASIVRKIRPYPLLCLLKF